MSDSAAATTSDASSDVGSPSSFRAAMAAMDSAPDVEFGADDPAAQVEQVASKAKPAKPPAPGPKNAKPGKSQAEQFIAQRAAAQLKKALAKEREIHGEEAPEPELEEETEDNSAQFEPEEQPDDEQPELEQEETEQPTDEQPQDELEQDGADTGRPTPEQAQAFWDACTSPYLPDELGDRLIKCTDGEREYDVPISEMKNGFMRQDRFTRGMQQVAAKEEAATAREQQAAMQMQEVRNHFQSWKQDIASAKRDIRRILGREAFAQLIEAGAKDIVGFEQMDPEKRAMALKLEEHEEAEYRRSMEAKRAEQQRQLEQQKPQQDPNMPAVLNFVSQSLPAVFERHNVWYQSPDGQLNNRAIHTFSEHLRFAWDGKHETVHQAMDAAMRATAYELGQSTDAEKGRMLKRAVPQHAAAPRRAPVPQRAAQPQPRQQLGPRAVPGAARRAADRNARGSVVTGGSPSDFRKLRQSNGLR